MCSTFRSFHRMNPIPYTSLSIRPHRARCPIPRCLGPSFARWQWTSRRAAPWWQTPGLLDIGAETRSGAVGGSLLVPQAETPCSGRNKSNGSSMFQCFKILFAQPPTTHTHTHLNLSLKCPAKHQQSWQWRRDQKTGCVEPPGYQHLRVFLLGFYGSFI